VIFSESDYLFLRKWKKEEENRQAGSKSKEMEQLKKFPLTSKASSSSSHHRSI